MVAGAAATRLVWRRVSRGRRRLLRVVSARPHFIGQRYRSRRRDQISATAVRITAASQGGQERGQTRYECSGHSLRGSARLIGGMGERNCISSSQLLRRSGSIVRVNRRPAGVPSPASPASTTGEQVSLAETRTRLIPAASAELHETRCSGRRGRCQDCGTDPALPGSGWLPGNRRAQRPRGP